MARYILKRVLLVIPVLLGVAFLVFFINSLSPGDPVLYMIGADASEEEYFAMQHELGLDQPFFVRFFHYTKDIVTKFDFGVSYVNKTPVRDELLARFPITFKLAMIGILISIVIGIICGVVSAVRQYSILDYIVTMLSTFFAAVPQFWLAMMLVVIFALDLRWLPASGLSGFKSWILPSLSLGLLPIASICRTTRSNMLEVIRQDYIRTARAKGVDEPTIIFRHALKNALIPVVTVVGIQIGMLMGGAAMIVETIFSIPGLGIMLNNAIKANNYPVIQGCVIFLSFVITILNLIVDIAYAFIDPRIRAQYSGKRGIRHASGPSVREVKSHE